jgi:hypothetical protein
MKIMIAITAAVLMAAATVPAQAATYAELNTEAQETHKAAEKGQEEAKALFANGNKTAGCALMMTVVSQRKRVVTILTAVKKSFAEGKGSKESRALFGDISTSVYITGLNVESSATLAAENGC